MKTVFSSCNSHQEANISGKVGSHYKINKIGKLPSIVSESSGLSLHTDGASYWTHNDSGGSAALYNIGSDGKLVAEKPVSNSQNKDWEDLATAPDGRIFIGDMGNNSNARQDLSIYIVQDINAAKPTASKISFRYPDQLLYPPAAEDLNFDCEAFFYFKDKLYLFSKNRSKTKKFTKLYQLDASGGNQTAVLKDSLTLDTQVTSADISPDGKQFVLLTYGKILFFEVDNGVVDFSKPTGCMKFVKKQAEAIAFIDNKDLLVTNEQGEIIKLTYR